MGSSLFVFLFSSLLLFQVSSRAVNISTSWTLPQEGFQHFFRYFQHPATWDDAKAVCSSFNAQLFTVETDERRDAARAYLKELDVLDNVWCGLERVNNQAPFVWTGGGQGPVVGDAYWQEAHPLDPERLCVAIEPLQDYRWQSFPCSGPQISSFVCQLQVPDWATGPEGCLVNSLPSLTVTYLSETDIIELLSDCGLSGTRRIACKGGENQEELIKRLSCEPLEDNHLYSRDWSTRLVRKWATSTPSNAISGYTYQMTHSSNTRHKRESGATSPSTDILLQTEPSLVHTSKTSIVPNLQTDHVTNAPEILSVKENIKEITTIPAVIQTIAPLAKGSTNQLSVKNWLLTHDSQLASTINTILPISQVTTSESITSSTRVTSEVTQSTTANLEQTTAQPRVKDLPPTLIQQKMYKKVIEKPLDVDEERKDIVNQVMDSNTADTEDIQIKEEIESLVDGKPKFEKVSLKESFAEKKIKDWKPVPTLTFHETPEVIPKKYIQEELVVETSTHNFLNINPISEEPRNIIPPKLSETVPTIDRPITEVTSKGSSEILTEKTTSEHKNTEAPIQTTVKKVDREEETEVTKLTEAPISKQKEQTKAQFMFPLKVLEELKVVPEKVVTDAPATNENSAVSEGEKAKIIESIQTSTVKHTTSTSSPNIPSSPLTSTYWPKIEPPSSTRSISTTQQIIENSKPADIVLFTDKYETSTPKFDHQGKILTEIISTSSSIKGLSTPNDLTPTVTTAPLFKTRTLKPEIVNVDIYELTTYLPLKSTGEVKKIKPSTQPKDTLDVIEVTPMENMEESASVLEIHSDVEIISHDGLKPIILPIQLKEEKQMVLVKSALPEGKNPIILELPEDDKSIDLVKPDFPKTEKQVVLVKSDSPETENPIVFVKSKIPEAEKPIVLEKSELPKTENPIVLVKSELPEAEKPIVLEKTELPQEEKPIVLEKTELPQEEKPIVLEKLELPETENPIVLVKSELPEEGKKENENEDESTTELPYSDDSSEESQNPKRTARGRLFPHSNPLSFYPYFLNRVLG